MNPARLDELVAHAMGEVEDSALRERVELALRLAHKVGRWQMREEAAKATITKRRLKNAKLIFNLTI